MGRVDYKDTLEKTRESLKTGASPRRWICEVHREIYDLIEHCLAGDDRRQGLDLVAEAFYYGKRMSDRLKEYKDPEGTLDIPENPDYFADLEKRANRLGLLKRIKSVNIETLDWCNRKCDWCPNKDREQSRSNLMHNDTIVHIAKELAAHNYQGEIHPFLNGEPTMDLRLYEICAFLKKLMPCNTIKVVTNGDGINSEEEMDLLFTVVDKIHMNHYSGPLAEMDRAKDSRYPGLSHYGMLALYPSFYNRAGKVDYEPQKKFKACPNFLHKLAFNWRGDMVLCCSDFNADVVFGNIMEEPLSMIMGSDRYQEYYRAHKDGTAKDLPLCKDCNLI